MGHVDLNESRLFAFYPDIVELHPDMAQRLRAIFNRVRWPLN